VDIKHVIECNPIIEYVEGLTGLASLKGENPPWMLIACPFCDPDLLEKSFQFSMNPDGNFVCHTCGRTGTDVISLVRQLHGCSNDVEAAKILGGKEDPHGDGPTFLSLIHVDLPKVGETIQLKRHGVGKDGLPRKDWMFKVCAVYTYRKTSGHVDQVVLRTDGTKNGRPAKWFAQLKWDGSDWWTGKHEAPTPIYNQHLLHRYPEYQVLIVEGEKDADAAAKALRKARIVVTTWQGGTSSWTSADWSPLVGRSVVGWPDADETGEEAMTGILSHLKEKGCKNTSIIVNEAGAKEGRGAADVKKGMVKFLKSRLERLSSEGVEPGDTVPSGSLPHTRPDEAPSELHPADQALDWLLSEMAKANISEIDQKFCPVPGCSSLISKTESKDEFWLICGIGHTGRQMMKALNPPEEESQSNVVDLKPKKEKKKRKKREPPGGQKSTPQQIFTTTEALRDRMLNREDSNFIILGSDNDAIYFMLKDSGHIHSYSAAAIMNRKTLCTLDSPEWWKKVWGGTYEDDDGETKTVGWQKIELDAGHAIARYAMLKRFDPTRVRGRGAWMENGRVVYNAGDKIYVGQDVREGHYHGGYVYSPGLPLPIDFSDIASDDEAYRIVQIMEGCSWEEPSSALLMAGWVAIAAIGGCLPWRPHVWFSGNHGVGKSCIRDHIVWPCLGKFSLKFSATNTTEPGVRQTLKNDCLPVLLDECESTNRKKTTDGLMEMARASSTGDQIMKGSPSGKSVAFTARSPFLFSAINPTAMTHADESRISKLVLKHSTEEAFQQVKALYEEHLTPEYSRRFVSRMVTLAPVILGNIPIFAEAVMTRYGSRRIADQLGTMLAGAYACFCSEEITPPNARGIVQDLKVAQSDEQMHENEAETIVEFLGSYLVKIAEGHGQQHATINELLDVLRRPAVDGQSMISKPVAEKMLKRYGMRVEEGFNGTKEIWIALKHPTLTGEVFKGRAWSGSYPDHLRNSFGGRPGSQQRFGPGKTYRRVIIPIETMLTEGGDDTVTIEDDEGELGHAF